MSRRTIVALTAILAVTAAPAAHAVEGPGYGGTADELAVVWQPVDQVNLAAGPSFALSQDPDLIRTEQEAARLVVRGVGFRGRSEIELRVGAGAADVLRVDESGTLEAEVRAAATEAAAPGTSVIAIGRAPSGAARTLVGAVPPLPSGVGPADIVPWAAVAVAVIATGSVVRRRSDRVEAKPDPAHGADEARL